MKRERVQLVREREGCGDAGVVSGSKGGVLHARNQGGEEMSLQDMFTGLQRSPPPPLPRHPFLRIFSQAEGANQQRGSRAAGRQQQEGRRRCAGRMKRILPDLCVINYFNEIKFSVSSAASTQPYLVLLTNSSPLK